MVIDRKVVILLVSWYNADLNACTVHNVSPLQLAAMKGHMHVVKVIISELNRQAKFDVKGSQSQAALTVLFHACKTGHKALAGILITDLIFLSPLLSTDSDGNTLLHIAAMNEQEQCVYMLLYTCNAPAFLKE